MKTPTRVENHRAHDDLAMTSMIDVVFLLLIFFVWTSSFDLPETNLPGSIAMTPDPVESPTAANPDREPIADEIKPTEIVVRILHQPDGKSFQIGAVELVDLSSVRKKLSTIARLPINTLVVIDPDPAVSVADTIEIFDLARGMNFSKVLLAVDPTSVPAR